MHSAVKRWQRCSLPPLRRLQENAWQDHLLSPGSNVEGREVALVQLSQAWGFQGHPQGWVARPGSGLRDTGVCIALGGPASGRHRSLPQLSPGRKVAPATVEDIPGNSQEWDEDNHSTKPMLQLRITPSQFHELTSVRSPDGICALKKQTPESCLTPSIFQ